RGGSSRSSPCQRKDRARRREWPDVSAVHRREGGVPWEWKLMVVHLFRGVNWTARHRDRAGQTCPPAPHGRPELRARHCLPPPPTPAPAGPNFGGTQVCKRVWLIGLGGFSWVFVGAPGCSPVFGGN